MKVPACRLFCSCFVESGAKEKMDILRKASRNYEISKKMHREEQKRAEWAPGGARWSEKASEGSKKRVNGSQNGAKREPKVTKSEPKGVIKSRFGKGLEKVRPRAVSTFIFGVILGPFLRFGLRNNQKSSGFIR